MVREENALVESLVSQLKNMAVEGSAVSTRKTATWRCPEPRQLLRRAVRTCQSILSTYVTGLGEAGTGPALVPVALLGSAWCLIYNGT